MTPDKHCQPASSLLLPSSNDFTRYTVQVLWRQRGQAWKWKENVKTGSDESGWFKEREERTGREAWLWRRGQNIERRGRENRWGEMRRWESFHVHQNHLAPLSDSHLTEIKCCTSTKRARALHRPTPCLLKSLRSLARWISPSPAKIDPSLLCFFLWAHDQWRNNARCLSHAVMKRKERKQKNTFMNEGWAETGKAVLNIL